MPNKNDNDFIKDYEKIRPVLRYFFLYGCFDRSYFKSKRVLSASKFDNEKRKVNTFLDQQFINDRNGKNFKKRKYLQLLYNMFYVQENYLNVSYFIKKISADKAKMIIDLLIILDESPKTLTEILDAYADQLANSDRTDPEQQVRRCLNELAEIGYIKKKQKSNTTMYYELTCDFFENFSRADMIDFWQLLQFFAVVAPITVPGYSLQNIMTLYTKQNRQNFTASPNTFLFKDAHLQQILDENIAAKIITAIKNRQPLLFEYKKQYEEEWEQKNPELPIKLFLDALYGRWYVITMKPGKDGKPPWLASRRLDRIRKVTNPPYAADVKSNYKEIAEQHNFNLVKQYEKSIKYSWCIQLLQEKYDFKPVLVELIFHLQKDNEKNILGRIHKEGHGGKLEPVGDLKYKYSIYVNDPIEMKPWIRSFTGFVEVLHSDEHLLKEDLEKQWKELFECYGIIS